MNTLMLIMCSASLLQVQGTPAPPSSSQSVRQVGVVVVVDPASRLITIKTDAGPQMNIAFEQGTSFLRVSPGASNLENAAFISASDLAVGDRILARGRAADARSFVATSILIMSKADIVKKHAAERAEWERRGVGGVIIALNPSSTEITIKTSTM